MRWSTITSRGSICRRDAPPGPDPDPPVRGPAWPILPAEDFREVTTVAFWISVVNGFSKRRHVLTFVGLVPKQVSDLLPDLPRTVPEFSP